MKQSFLNHSVLLLLIIVVNILPQPISMYIRPLPATIALVLLVIIHTYIILKQRTETAPALIEKEHENVIQTLTPAETDFKSLSDFVNYAKKNSADSETADQLELELNTYMQCYLWVQKMEKKYDQQWRALIQGAEMPICPETFPKIRSLIMEIALHTTDFCRYRTHYVNLSEQMMVNPTSILLDKDLKEAGAVPISDNPFKTPREVRALGSLIRNDEIQLNGATIHGYYIEENEQ